MGVLLVEDDALVRVTLCECLEETGLCVLDAGDAESALAALDSAAHRVLVLVTDLNLGSGPDGLALAAEARRRVPDLQVIYETGSPERLAGHRLAAWERLFVKPFDPGALAGELKAIMSEARSVSVP